jgi:hypothetical protein
MDAEVPMRTAALLSLLLSTACGPGVLVADPLPDTEPQPPTVLPGYPDGIRFDVSLTGTTTTGPGRLTLEIFGGNSFYDYGFAQTDRDEGYVDEDCLFSDVCHPVGQTGAVLTSGPSFTPGSATAFVSSAPRRDLEGLTHIVRDRFQDYCWVWGDDPSYYSISFCEVLDDPFPSPTQVPQPEPTPEPAFGFRVQLVDGDGINDAIGGDDDGDAIALFITGGTGSYEFGLAQTAVGPFQGWFGEDCFTGDLCHPTGPDGVILSGVREINAIVPGQTTLIPVDFPEEATPDLTYYVGRPSDLDATCWVWGDDPAYYAALGCQPNPLP